MSLNPMSNEDFEKLEKEKKKFISQGRKIADPSKREKKNKDYQIILRLTNEERDLLNRVAEIECRSLSSMIRSILIPALKKADSQIADN